MPLDWRTHRLLWREFAKLSEDDFTAPSFQ
jgi:hypothetical protein